MPYCPRCQGDGLRYGLYCGHHVCGDCATDEERKNTRCAKCAPPEAPETPYAVMPRKAPSTAPPPEKEKTT